MILEDFKPFVGQHCETTATGSLLNQLGLELSEPLLFGIGEGLHYIYWNMKSMDYPFIGGRVKPDVLTENICRNLNLRLEVAETSSLKKAWNNISDQLDSGKLVGLKLDCYHLDYFSTRIHFAGHYVAMYGYDHEYAYLIDTDQQGGRVKTTLESLAKARSEKGPMSSRNRSYTIDIDREVADMQETIRKAILNNTENYLSPPIKNLSYLGIAKTAVEIKKWFKSSKDVQSEFQTTATLMERAGTGGSIFRNLYRDFLKESYELLRLEGIREAHQDFVDIAKSWKHISELFYSVGETRDIKHVNQASEILLDLSVQERKAMEQLNEVCSQ